MLKNESLRKSNALVPIGLILLMLIVVGVAFAIRAPFTAAALPTPTVRNTPSGDLDPALVGDWSNANDGDPLELTIEADGSFTMDSEDTVGASMTAGGHLESEGSSLYVWFDHFMVTAPGHPANHEEFLSSEPMVFTWNLANDRLVIEDDQGETYVLAAAGKHDNPPTAR